MHPREQQRWADLGALWSAMQGGPRLPEVSATAETSATAESSAAPEACLAVEAPVTATVIEDSEKAEVVSTGEAKKTPATVTESAPTEVVDAPEAAAVIVAEEMPGAAEAIVAETTSAAAKEASEVPASEEASESLEALPTAVDEPRLLPVVPSWSELRRLSAAEFFALVPFEQAGIEPADPPPPRVSDWSRLSAGDYFGAAVPWDGASLLPRAELGNLLALATRDAMARASRFAAPALPPAASSAGAYFQNLNWQGVKVHAG